MKRKTTARKRHAPRIAADFTRMAGMENPLRLAVEFFGAVASHEASITFGVGADEALFAQKYVSLFLPENARRRAEFRAGLAALVWNEAKRDLQIVSTQKAKKTS